MSAEDFMAVVACAENLRNERLGRRLPHKGPGLRRLIEPAFNVAGQMISRFVEALPAAWAIKVHDVVLTTLAGGRRFPFDPDEPALAASRELVRETAARAGRAPALLCLMSHPPVTGLGASLMFAMIRHAVYALRAVRGAACRPRLVVAVDPFALDSTPLAGEALYAGTMGLYHLGLDRMAMARNPCSARLMGHASWPRMPWRLIRALRSGGEVGMVLAGGVPATTRLLYAAREWAAGTWAQSPLRGDPSRVARRLGELPRYRDFEVRWGRRRGVAKAMGLWLAAELSGQAVPGGPGDAASADAGTLGAAVKSAAGACLEAMGLPEREREAALAELAGELSRETPYRARLFRILARRVVARGRPLVLLPLSHSMQGEGSLEIKPAWVLDAGGSIKEFARRFVSAHFA